MSLKTYLLALKLGLLPGVHEGFVPHMVVDPSHHAKIYWTRGAKANAGLNAIPPHVIDRHYVGTYHPESEPK